MPEVLAPPGSPVVELGSSLQGKEEGEEALILASFLGFQAKPTLSLPASVDLLRLLGGKALKCAP